MPDAGLSVALSIESLFMICYFSHTNCINLVWMCAWSVIICNYIISNHMMLENHNTQSYLVVVHSSSSTVAVLLLSTMYYY